jgi:phenylpropionate dioxygenase-like ring-hydroxylating dioxygenase large terminal subunit
MAPPEPPMIGLPVASYTSPAGYADDVKTRLLPSWQFAGHASDLPGPGTALRFDFCGRSAVVLRNQSGGLAAFSNVCRHRGSLLVEGDRSTGLAYCVDARLRCPYHGWTYGSDGALVDVPEELVGATLDRGGVALKPLQIANVDGWLFIAFEPPPTESGPALDAVRRAMTDRRPLQMRRLIEPRALKVQANWKLVCEERLDPQVPSFERLAGAERGRGAERSVPGDHDCSRSGSLPAAAAVSWSMRTYLAQLARLELPPRERSGWTSTFIWPNTLFETSPDQVVVTQVLPSGARESLVRENGYGLPDVSRPMRAARFLNRRLRARSGLARARDLERVQAGLETGEASPALLFAHQSGVRWFATRARGERTD